MKIIHTADIRLGSKMDSRFNKEISNERKSETKKFHLRTDSEIYMYFLITTIFYL